MSEKGRAEEVDAVLEETSPDFVEVPWRSIELPARRCITIDEALDASENMFQENGVGASPAAPEAS